MKLSRFKAIHNGMNGNAKKVYEAVPISSHWSQYKVMRELERLGVHMDMKMVQGCLGYMLSAGIIERDKDGDFMRTPLKIANNTTPDDLTYGTGIPTKEETEMATTPSQEDKAAPAPVTVFDILASLAQRAQSIVDQAEDLKDDIEKAALQAQVEQEQTIRDLAKLKQFQALLAALKD